MKKEEKKKGLLLTVLEDEKSKIKLLEKPQHDSDWQNTTRMLRSRGAN